MLSHTRCQANIGLKAFACHYEENLNLCGLWLSQLTLTLKHAGEVLIPSLFFITQVPDDSVESFVIFSSEITASSSWYRFFHLREMLG